MSLFSVSCCKDNKYFNIWQHFTSFAGGLKATTYVSSTAKIVKIAELKKNQYDCFKILHIPDSSGPSIGYLSLRSSNDNNPTLTLSKIDNVIRTLTLYKKDSSIYVRCGMWSRLRVESLNGSIIPLAEQTDLSPSDLTEIK